MGQEIVAEVGGQAMEIVVGSVVAICVAVFMIMTVIKWIMFKLGKMTCNWIEKTLVRLEKNESDGN